MRLSILFILFIVITPAFAQSKKELQAEVAKLKGDVAALNTQIEDLKKPKTVDLNTNDKKVAYGIGTLIASNLKQQGGDSLDIEALTFGVKDIMQNVTPKVEQQEAMAIVQEYMQKKMEKKSSAAKEIGQKFLEANKTREGVKVTPSGLQYKVITAGNGKSPKAADNVTVHYTGKLIDGTVFDSSVERGEPATFGVGQVIPGWTEALQMMKEGDKWMLFIPSDLAYGERGAGGQIPPHSTLIFEVELLKVNPSAEENAKTNVDPNKSKGTAKGKSK
jgi:FKBP-type peptidyl-prolyl cis-trans isomerase